MKYILLSLVFLGLVTGVGAQNNALILHNSVAINIENGAVLVIAQSNASGIARTGTANGVILSESETDRVAWIINNGTGSYTIPFGKSLATAIPMTYTITGAGSTPGTLVASTYPTAWQNTPMPSVYAPVVTTMTMDYPTDDLSEYVVDRFYVLRSNSDWTTKPTTSLTLSYDNIEWTAASNTITETNLLGQYWNTNQWSPGWNTGSLLLGTNDAANNRVTGINAAANGNLFTWILVDQTHPLPVEMLSFNVSCANGSTPRLEWTTASETNNAGFQIERSSDLLQWQTVAFVSGAGNSNSPLYYFYDDAQATEGLQYYRLIQTDFDGTSVIAGSSSSDCAGISSNGSFGLNIYSDEMHEVFVSFTASESQKVQLEIFDAAGKLVNQSSFEALEGINTISDIYLPLSDAMYFFRLSGSQLLETKMFFLQ